MARQEATCNWVSVPDSLSPTTAKRIGPEVGVRKQKSGESASPAPVLRRTWYQQVAPRGQIRQLDTVASGWLGLFCDPVQFRGGAVLDPGRGGHHRVPEQMRAVRTDLLPVRTAAEVGAQLVNEGKGRGQPRVGVHLDGQHVGPGAQEGPSRTQVPFLGRESAAEAHDLVPSGWLRDWTPSGHFVPVEPGHEAAVIIQAQ